MEESAREPSELNDTMVASVSQSRSVLGFSGNVNVNSLKTSQVYPVPSCPRPEGNQGDQKYKEYNVSPSRFPSPAPPTPPCSGRNQGDKEIMSRKSQTFQIASCILKWRLQEILRPDRSSPRMPRSGEKDRDSKRRKR